MATIKNNPLGLVMNIVDALGLEVTYAYADLVFVAHNAFLLQMSETPEIVNLFFNVESDVASRPSLTAKLQQHALENGLRIVDQGLFALEQQEGESIKITFPPPAAEQQG